MGREIRRVVPNWQHPKNTEGYYIPLHYDFQKALRYYQKEKQRWDNKLVAYQENYPTFEAYMGTPPDPKKYMPVWTTDQATAYQIYETISEGTPVSPVCASREELIDWLVNVGEKMGIGRQPYKLTREQAEQWIDEEGWAPSFCGTSDKFIGGFEAITQNKKD